METQTKPCEACGKLVTKEPRQQKQRLYWTCGKACSVQLSMQAGRRASWQPNRFRGQRETRACVRCTKPVTRYVTEQNHDQEWRCSRECSLAYQAGKPRARSGDEIPCDYCGTVFYRQPALIHRNQTYCSDDCAHKGRIVPKVEKSCERCGKTMMVYPAQFDTRRFCSRVCNYAGQIKRPTGRMHNGKPVREMNDGYIKIWEPEHPAANRGWVIEHRWIMEQHLGRYLTREEEVDHKNENRSDNRLENLQVLSKPDHRKKTWGDRNRRRLTMHQELEAFRARYGPLPVE